jgi:murein DD-endopeptidase MepM/ murein hydrolase activator NlpD
MLRCAAIVLLMFAVAAHAQPPVGGRVVIEEDFADATPAELVARMQQRAAANVEALARAGLVVSAKATATTADLQWPLRVAPDFTQFDYHGLSNFVDLDARFPGFVRDYMCGTRSYDLASGYNHAGTDYYLWPFPWLMMDERQVAIVAAAPGIVIDREDGNFDRNCAIGASGNPNYVAVLQDDGLSAIYMHMRSGSVTTVPIGTRVDAGDYLGLVGSSGSSSAPHLHFELRDSTGVAVDPRHGACNAAADLWLVPQPYEDPSIDSLSTHAAEPQQVGCGDVGGLALDDAPNYKDVFTPGDTLWVFASYRDHRNGEPTNFRIKRPDGSTFAQWEFDLATAALSRTFYSGTAWDWKFWLPAGAPPGVWQIAADFAGRNYVRQFRVRQRPLHAKPPHGAQ